MNFETVIKQLFGYCWMCRRWFVYPKMRRMNTAYVDEEANYCTVCKSCFEEVEKRRAKRGATIIQDYYKEG